MEYRVLGRSGMRVSRLSFGTMTFGSQTDEATADRMIGRCLDAGMNFFDTADMYNQGKSEEILGRVLRKHRNRVVLATKVRNRMGEDPNQQGLSRRWILSAVEGSLRRLGTDVIDLYYMHLPDYDTPLEESMLAMDTLVKQGKVRHVAVSNFASWQVAQMLWIADRRSAAAPVASQSMYNLLARAIDVEHVPFCREFKLGLVVYNPLAGGLLSGKHDFKRDPTEGTRFHKNEMYLRRYWNESMFRAVEQLSDVARRTGKTLVQLSLQWLMQQATVDSIILGASSMAHLEENLKSAEGTLDDDTIKACDEVYARLAGPIPKYNR